MKTLSKITILTILCFVPVVVLGQNSPLKIPDEVKVFIEKEMTAIALESADLNGDGTMDFILVTEKTKPQPTDDDTDDLRSLIILTSDKTGKLTLAVRNEKIVYCRSCGGSFGDPFDGVEANRKSFTVYNYGGSWQRWGDYYQFNYSRRDKTWQLLLVEKISYDSHYADKVKTKTFTPKKFGKINIAKFDPATIP
jgi:hypothetical protein